MQEHTTVTASLSKDSPKTTMYKISFTCISSNTANTATGSTADIRAANRNNSKTDVSPSKNPIALTSHKDPPVIKHIISRRE